MSTSSSRNPLQITVPTEKTIEQLNVLNSAILPVRYGPKFYSSLLTDATYSAHIALFNEVLVGGITVKKLKDKDGKSYLYIMTIGVLSAYRGRTIGSQLLKKVEEQAEEDKGVDYIELHVQLGNDDALSFYAKHGYTNVELVENYYQKVTPASAHRLTKSVTHKS